MDAGVWIPLVSLALVLLTCMILVYMVWNQIFTHTTLRQCPMGQCATNVYNGDKQCPGSTGVDLAHRKQDLAQRKQVMYNPALEVCNETHVCTDPRTPCMYYDDSIGTICPGSEEYRRLGGVCPLSDPEQCKCMARTYCPDFATVYFQQMGISGFSEFAYLQSASWTGSNGITHNLMPMSPATVNSDSGATCGVSTENFHNIWPPECIRGSLTYSTRDNLWYCTNVPVNLDCGGSYVPTILPDGKYTCTAVGS